jgi:hypothetical protein
MELEQITKEWFENNTDIVYEQYIEVGCFYAVYDYRLNIINLVYITEKNLDNIFGTAITLPHGWVEINKLVYRLYQREFFGPQKKVFIHIEKKLFVEALKKHFVEDRFFDLVKYLDRRSVSLFLTNSNVIDIDQKYSGKWHRIIIRTSKANNEKELMKIQYGYYWTTTNIEKNPSGDWYLIDKKLDIKQVCKNIKNIKEEDELFDYLESIKSTEIEKYNIILKNNGKE